MGKVFSVIQEIKNRKVIISIIFVLIILLILDVSFYLFKGDNKLVQTFILLSFSPILAIGIYLFIRSKKTNADQVQLSIRYTYIISIIFLVLIIFCLITIITEPKLYERPVIFFIFMSLAIGILSIDIFASPLSDKKVRYFTISKIILTAIVLQFVPLYMHPNLPTSDSLWHEAFTSKILNNEHIPQYESYAPFPIMHLTIASLMEITGLNFKNSTILSVTSLNFILMPILIFLIGFKIFEDYRLSLLSALVSTLLDIPLGMSLVGAFPTLFATTMVLIVVFLLYKKELIFKFLSVLFMITVVITHSLTGLLMILLLLTFFMMKLMFKLIYNEQIKLSVSHNLIFLSVVYAFGYWMFNANFIFKRLVNTLFLDVGGSTSLKTINGLNYAQSIPLLEYFISFFGGFILYFFVTIGILYSIFRMKENKEYIVFAMNSIILLIFGGFSFLLKLGSAPDRLMYYAYILLPIVTIKGIHFLTFFMKYTFKLVFIFLVMTTFSFFMITSPLSNGDSPIYSKDLVTQSYMTYSEIYSIDTIIKKYDGIVGTDHILFYYFTAKKNRQADRLDFFSGDFKMHNNSLILIREFYKYEPIFSNGLYRINYDIDTTLCSQGFNKIYDSLAISAYTK